jgi:dihydrofolate synthase/folylpolyglutamate synthase
MALAYFAREKTEVAIMEVGMGGRLDATNVITPLVTAITNISLEHQAYLGPHLLDIAGEKAGIVKEGVDVITGAQQRAVVQLIESVCQKKKAPLWRVGRDFRYRMKGGLLHYYGMTHRMHGLELGLKGQFQGRNAALALAVIERLGEMGFRISSDDVRAGLKHVVWPGRMHVLARDPTIILDGAHNPGAVKTLARSLKADFQFRSLILVIGVMADKDIAGILREIVPISDYVIYTRPVYSRAASPDILAAKAKGFGKPGRVVPVLTEALEEARKMAQKEDLIVVCGSLFTVGEALTHFDPEKNRPDGF